MKWIILLIVLGSLASVTAQDGRFHCDFKPCESCNWLIYVGGEMGGACGFGTHRSRRNGPLFNGTSRHARAEPGYHVGLFAGCQFSRYCRTDVSYTRFHHKYTWITDFPTFDTPSLFSGWLTSHLALLNFYTYIAQLYEKLCICPPRLIGWVNPYLTVGIGAAVNNLDRIREHPRRDPRVTRAYTETNFAGKAGIGFYRCFCDRWSAHLAFNASYIGLVRTGSRFEFEIIPIETVGPYKFRDNWLGSFHLGLQAHF